VTLRDGEEADRPAEKDLDLPARSPACQSHVRRAGASAKAGRNLLSTWFEHSRATQRLIFSDDNRYL